MNPQYVARHCSSKVAFVAAESQPRTTKSVSYLFHRLAGSFPQGYTQVAYPQDAGEDRRSGGLSRVENRDRRQICPRASRAFLLCPCWPSWQHVAQTIQVTWKNLRSLTQFQSQSSPFTLARCRGGFPALTGQATPPVPFRATPTKGFA